MTIGDRLSALWTCLADAMASTAAIVAVVAVWLPWALNAANYDTALDHWFTGGAFTAFQLVLAGQRDTREADELRAAALVRATPDAPDELADADRLPPSEVRRRRKEQS